MIFNIIIGNWSLCQRDNSPSVFTRSYGGIVYHKFIMYLETYDIEVLNILPMLSITYCVILELFYILPFPQ